MTDISTAQVEKIHQIVGLGGVDLEPRLRQEWSRNTLDSFRHIQAIVKPQFQEQVIALIKLFHQESIAYYPISSGKNWGYGGATPVSENMVILDLSGLKRIIEFNSELSYVVVEPGVTQQDLHDYMRVRNLNFMVPTTGAGPDASLMGNALERGYGITPIEDHFLSLLSLKVALPTGEIYKSSLLELGGDAVDSLFKWKLGPYLDGIFTQSNLGVCLEASIGLVPKPENVTQFVIFINDEEFENGVKAVRNIKTRLAGMVGGINLMNKRRLLSMVEENWDRERALEEIHVIEFAKKRALPDWAMVGALYGPSLLVDASRKLIKEECRSFSRKVVFLSRRKYEFASRALKYMPLRNLKKMLANAGRALEILEGTPSKVALPLAYLKNKNGVPKNRVFNPDQDNCGLVWFAPLLPLDPPIVRDYAQELSRICLFHDIDPLITLTAFSSRFIDSTIPILFSKENSEDIKKAKNCYEDLLKECQTMGLFPYRLDIDHMHLLSDPSVPAFAVAQKIKKILDPKNVLAPGRYIP